MDLDAEFTKLKRRVAELERRVIGDGDKKAEALAAEKRDVADKTETASHDA